QSSASLRGRLIEGIAQEMHVAPLPGSAGEHLADRLLSGRDGRRRGDFSGGRRPKRLSDYALSSAIKSWYKTGTQAVSAGVNDGAQQGAISKGAQRGPVCCSLRNRGSVPGGGDALALAIRLCLPGLRRGAAQLGQDPGALPVYRLSTADIRDRRNDFRGDQGAAVHLVSRHVPPHSEQGRDLQHGVGPPAWPSPRPPPGRSSTSSCRR